MIILFSGRSKQSVYLTNYVSVVAVSCIIDCLLLLLLLN